MSVKKPKILVVGSLVMDMISITETMPKEGQTVLGNTFSTAPGGKGANQAMQAALLGADVTMVGRVGEDAFGDILLATLNKAGVHTEHVLRTKGKSSAVGNVIIQTKHGITENNRIIVLPGANMAVTTEDIAFLEEEIANYDFLILQLEIPMEVNQKAAEYAAAKGVPVMLNPAPIAELPRELVKYAAYLSPNETEAERLLGVHIEAFGKTQDDAAAKQIQNAMRRQELNRILMTLGGNGAAIISQTECIHLPAVQNIQTVDPTAAGDSFVGAFCTAKCLALNDADAVRFANMIASVTVSGMGAMPSLPTLDKAIHFHETAGRETTILRNVQNVFRAQEEINRGNEGNINEHQRN